MRTMILLLASLAATGAIAQIASAQTVSIPAVAPTGAAPAPSTAPNAAADPAAMRARLLAADTNKDGKWDLAEWLAAGRREQGFRFMDANKDGFLTQDEIIAGMQRMRAMRMGGSR